MTTAARVMCFLLALAGVLAHAQISSFQHIILVIQENRTPDNLFQGLHIIHTLQHESHKVPVQHRDQELA